MAEQKAPEQPDDIAIGQIIKNRADATIKRFSDCEKSLCILTHNRNPEAVGTGILLRVHDQHFLVTAEHVLEQAGDQDLIIFGVDRSLILGRKGIIRFKDKRIDIALFPLSIVDLAKIKRFRSFTEADIATQSYESPYSNYLVCGLPKIKFHPIKKQYLVLGPGFTLLNSDIDESDLEHLSRQTHLILDCDRKNMTTTTGEKRELSIKGCSGGPIYCFGPDPRAGSDEAKLIGITTSWYKTKRVLVGTRLSAFYSGIAVIAELLKSGVTIGPEWPFPDEIAVTISTREK